jgi:catechol 2,3-dioxygenase-like lactoylglutathione lyase family enzyme
MSILQGSLQLHHVGCLTANIEESLDIYVNILGLKKTSDIVTISDQQVRVCFVETAPGVFLELVEPNGENFTLRKLIKSKNAYYHTGYLVKDISTVIGQLQEVGFYLVNRFISEAFDNRECAFLYTREMHLIELIEKPK